MTDFLKDTNGNNKSILPATKRLHIDLVDLDTGEVLGGTRRLAVIDDKAIYERTIKVWSDCCYRGLQKGRNLSLVLNFSNSPIKVSQIELFDVY